MAKAEDLKLQALLEHQNIWQMKNAKEDKKGTHIHTNWMPTWREVKTTRNVHLGAARRRTKK